MLGNTNNSTIIYYNNQNNKSKESLIMRQSKLWLRSIVITILVVGGAMIALSWTSNSTVDKNISITTLNNKLDTIINKLNGIENNSMPVGKLAVLRELLGAYQVTLSQDSIYLWDCDRYVGSFALDYDADPLSTMILEDNE